MQAGTTLESGDIIATGTPAGVGTRAGSPCATAACTRPSGGVAVAQGERCGAAWTLEGCVSMSRGEKTLLSPQPLFRDEPARARESRRWCSYFGCSLP